VKRKVGRGLLCAVAVLLLAETLSAAASPTEPPRVTANKLAILDKLNAGQFAALNADLITIELQAENDRRFEVNAMVAFSAFEAAYSEKLIDRWISSTPNSSSAHMAKAAFLAAQAWRWRSKDWIQNVPGEKLAQMNDCLDNAAKEADAAISLNPKLTVGYALRIRAARTGSDHEDMALVVGEALKSVPASFAVREQIMYALRPRWGGSREQMRRFATSSQAYAAKNPEMRFLKGFPLWDAGDDFADRQVWPEAIDYYTQALKVGGEYQTPYRRRACAFFAMGKYEEAARDAERANALFPDNPEVLDLLARSNAQLGRNLDSIRWMTLYFKFELPDEQSMQLMKEAASRLKSGS
jgi:tetratricopeptide (TPR) repeat protein